MAMRWNLRGARGRVRLVCALGIGGLAIAGSGPAAAQQNATSVSLVRQDFSDCQNGNVNDDNKLLTNGVVWIVRNGDGTTSIKVSMTVGRATTYHFYLKCVRQLGDITTDEEGVGEAVFSFPTNLTGAVFAFDMYPDGAPAGNKFQSVQVRFP